MNRSLAQLAAAMVLAIALTVAYHEAVAVEAAKAPPKSAPAKRKAWWNAWAPENKPLRGIISFDGRQAGESRFWRPFCERHGLAWCEGEDDILISDRLAEIGAELGRPELVNAPVIRTGLSAIGGYTILFAQEHPDRVLAAVATQPLGPFAKGNEDFNFNRPNTKSPRDRGDLQGKIYDVSQALRVPILIQTGENDPTCGSVLAYGLVKFGRKQNAPWTYLCLPRGGHGNAVPRELLMPWLEAVIAQRLPADVDLRQGPPKLKEVKVEAGWLGHTQTLDIAVYAQYDGERSKAVWLPDKASAEAWKKCGLGMPYEFPEQPLRQPSGLIADLVVHDPQANWIGPSDVVSGEPWKLVANLREGDNGWKVQPNCTVTVLGKVPDLVRGCDWIKPDNAAADFTGETLLEFTVTDKSVVYVGHDEKVAKKPAWLADWKDTGQSVLGGYFGTEHSFRLLEKAFPKGAKIKLGPNGQRPKDPKSGRPEGWSYITIVKPSSAK
jgi:hypothetical protein